MPTQTAPARKFPAPLMFSSRSEEWSTPDDFYHELDAEFHFELDPAASAENHKCPRYFTKETNGLLQPWAPFRTFVNPPYGRGITGLWVEKAYKEAKAGALVVMLLPARTDTSWFHNWIYPECHTDYPDEEVGVELRFIRGRLKFGGCADPAPFPSMVVIFRPRFPAAQ